MNNAAKIVVIGTYWRKYLENSLNVAPEHIRIVHNGVPMSDVIPGHNALESPLIGIRAVTCAAQVTPVMLRTYDFGPGHVILRRSPKTQRITTG